MLQSKVPIGVFAAGVTSLAALWLSRPKPYPPRDWSEEAQKFPDHIRLGLGPFFYYCEEKGASTPVDRVTEKMRQKGIEDLDMVHMMKPGLDTNSDGFVLTSRKSVDRVKDKLREIAVKYSKRSFDMNKWDTELLSLTRALSKESPVRVSMRLNMGEDFNSVVSFEDRRKTESIVCDILASTVGGSYHPLCGNKSREHVGVQSMTSGMLDVLRSQELMFEAPWTTFDLSAGLGRHWPDARGVWLVESQDDYQIVVWVNHEDHIEIVGISDDGVGLTKKMETMRQEIASKLPSIARSDEFGYLSVKPEYSGTGLTVAKTVRLDRLASHPRFSQLTKCLGLQVTDLGNRNYQLVSTERFGVTLEEATARAVAAFRVVSNLDTFPDASEMIERLLAKVS